MAPDGAGGTIVVWQESFRGTSDLYAQRVNASGVLQWAANGVPCVRRRRVPVRPGAPCRMGPAARSSRGTTTATPSSPIVYAQRINSAGGLQWTAAGVALSTAAGFQYFPAIVSDGLGGAIVVWTDTRNGNYRRLRASRVERRRSASGPPTGSACAWPPAINSALGSTPTARVA